MADEIAIRVNGVSKDFVLPHEKVSSVKSLFTSAFRRRKTKETQHALKDISFDIKKGEFFGIVGRNGSGKSTLLKILAGIYQPTDGSVEVHGKLVPFIELGVGFNPELTGRENVYLNGAMLGFSQKEVEAMYEDIVEFAELERFMDQKLKNYSSGMQVRLAFSMAVRADADILLIDEVLAVGDADFQRKCFNYFKRLKKDKKTVVFVSHDMEAVREYCERALLIDGSVLKVEGTSDTIAEEYIKLFNPENKVSSDTSEQSERWGDGTAQYTRVSAEVNPETILVNVEYVSEFGMEAPIFGVQISDAQGRAVCGTNTKIIGEAANAINKGTKGKATWQIPNIFSTGKYIVDVAITHPDGITQADWWHSACEFEAYNKRSTPHITSPAIKLLDR